MPGVNDVIDFNGRRRRRLLAHKRSLTAGDREGFGRACRLVPRIEAMVRDFDLAPWMRLTEKGFRHYELQPCLLAPMARRSLEIHVCAAAPGESDAGHDLQTIYLTHSLGEQTTHIVVKDMPSLYWTMMSKREVVQQAGSLAAIALGVLRSHAHGTGIVDERNARQASRYASMQHCGPVAAGTPRSDYIDVWSIEARDDALVICPIVESIESCNVSPLDMLRYTGAYQQISAAERALQRA